MSRPAFSMVVRIHLEIVSLATGLCGLTKLMNALVSFPLKGFVRLRYSVKCSNTHKVIRICFEETCGGLVTWSSLLYMHR